MITRLFIITLIVFKSFFIFWTGITYAGVSDIIGNDKPQYLVKPPSTGDDSAEGLVLKIIAVVIDILLFFAGLVAVIMIIVWGIRYITFFWVQTAEDEAKMLIINSILWLGIVLCSALIVNNAERIFKFIIA